MLLWTVPVISVGSPDTLSLPVGDFVPVTEKMHVCFLTNLCGMQLLTHFLLTETMVQSTHVCWAGGHTVWVL